MTSINPLQTTLQNLYAQLGNNLQSNSQATKTDPNTLHNLGVSAGLVQNLRQDLNGVRNGSNPERALNNLLAGLQQLMRSTDGHPAGTQYRGFVKGEDGKSFPMAKEWPAGKELPAGSQYKDFVKGEDGKPVAMAEEWPAGKELPAGTQYKDFVKGEDGKPKALETSETQRSELLDLTATVQTYTDSVVSRLKTFLDAEEAGGDVAQASADLRSALQSLFDNSPLASNPDMVRDALSKSILSQT